MLAGLYDIDNLHFAVVTDDDLCPQRIFDDAQKLAAILLNYAH